MALIHFNWHPMEIIRSPKIFQARMEVLRRREKHIGFVPTMGALHEGHLELVRRARQDNDVTAVSIFVNPTQFGPKEDFKRYPRPLARDKKLLRRAKADFLFLPSVQAIYPDGASFAIDVQPENHGLDLTRLYCGRSRPGHFRGVLTVCAKLFEIARPHRVYFGAKDYQQSVLIEKLIAEFHMGIGFVRVPTIREPDGLAKSSRNVYLSPEERRRALALSRVLFRLRDALQTGRRDLKALLANGRRDLSAATERVDYLEAADPVTLVPLAKVQKHMVILAACSVGKTRLIDNVILDTKQQR